MNGHFKAILSDLNFYSNDQIVDLSVLWQLRHSFVHSGGWLTLPDSQKIATLKRLGGRPLGLQQRFIEETVRRFHDIISLSMQRLRSSLKKRVSASTFGSNELIALTEMVSPRRAWLKEKSSTR